jgi:hypothetical protein
MKYERMSDAELEQAILDGKGEYVERLLAEIRRARVAELLGAKHEKALRDIVAYIDKLSFGSPAVYGISRLASAALEKL